MLAGQPVRRFEVHLISLDQARGSDIKKTRPCLVISPDEMNRHIRTVIMTPMTTTVRDYPTRITIEFQGKKGQIVLDQIRTVDKKQLTKKVGEISSSAREEVTTVLQEMFAL